MAHFARIDENNIVTRIIVVSNDKIINPETGIEDEDIGISYCTEVLELEGNWIQTSYNDSFRVRYAGMGFAYNEELDAFIPPKPFQSWILDNDTADWVSPLGAAPELTEEQRKTSGYIWDEEAYQADNTQGWVLVTP